jgi:hypothetical protein
VNPVTPRCASVPLPVKESGGRCDEVPFLLRDPPPKLLRAWNLQVTGNAGGTKKKADWTQLQIECDSQARINLGHQTRRDLSNTLGQIVLVQGDYLRDDRDPGSGS